MAQIKSALVQTGDPVHAPSGSEVLPLREGGGLVDLARADAPLLFATPTGLSFGRLAPGQTAARTVELADAGGGAGDWAVASQTQTGSGTLAVPATITVPGTLTVTATGGATAGDAAGFILLTRGTDVRRIPFWFQISTAQLASESRPLLPRAGTYRRPPGAGRRRSLAIATPQEAT